ncbi:MAG: hypothetical protein ACREMJ_12945 [Gemmatimonadales bacterium]
MRRSIVPMSLALAALSTPLAAQSSLAVGLAATVGDGWQLEGVDVALVRGVALGPLRRASLGVRVASFVDQRAFFSGSRGVVGGVAVAARTATARIAELGHDPDVTQVGFDVTFEAAGYLAANSPLPQGSAWLGAALLPGIRVGDPAGGQFVVLLGPTVFFGRDAGVRALLGVRAEFPLARAQPAP